MMRPKGISTSRHELMLTTFRLGRLAAPGTVRWPTSRSNRPSYDSFTEEVVQAVELDGVPFPLVRQTPISTAHCPCCFTS
jgi:hypothetical protein